MATVRGVPQSQSSGESPGLSRLWWLPLAFVIITLLVLAIVPMVVDQRVRAVRNGVVAASDRARVLLNDLEAAIATEMLEPDSSVAGDGSARHAARLQVAVDADSLELVVGGVDGETSRRFEHLRSLLAGWTKAPLDASTNAGALTLARAILATADSLDLHLSIVSESRRADVRRLERLDAVSAVVLVPIALIAIGVVIWSGQRVLHFARVAEHERAEVVKSTESRTALLRGVTHDLKNPLGAASGYAQLLADGVVGELTPKQVDMIRRIRRLVDTSVRTVSDLLDLARANGAGMHIERQAVDLTAIAHEIVDDYRGLARENGLAMMFAG
ncbi:MAG TPA: histidine kinase dimerization/phospho-acceptor domain-containing protein, partial [Gemmatimonadaceae bacterium]|nr:histidine kinase dimerization/phospho-acceptor domain-containing protein [Gemmatimonadaceae bacterium]